MTTCTTDSKNKSQQRVFGLDIFRAVAIILVVIGHGGFLLNETRFSNFPYFKTIDGVDLFFVLSGYLIGGILIKELSKTESFGFKQLVHFWKRRWFRTLPNYYLVLMLNYLVISTGIIHEDINQFSWKFLFFLHNFTSPFYGFFWESWSLSVEEWFYIITPITLFLLIQKLNAKQAYFWSVVILLIAPILYRIYSLDPNIDGFWYDSIFRKVVLMRLDSIAYGLLAAWIHWFYPHIWKIVRWPAFVVGLALMHFIIHYQSPVTSLYKQLVYLSITPISAVLLIPLASTIFQAKGAIARAVTHISKISYSMYLINLALVAEVIRDNFPVQGEMDGLLKYGLFWFIVVGASTLIYNYFEKPMMNLRERF